MARHTALYSQHLAAGAKMVDFTGWDMPLHYGSQLQEHHHVRSDAGMFDVSHMNITDIMGVDAGIFLRYLLANNIDKLGKNGKALYTCMLNVKGGVVDDLIVYKITDTHYRLVLNAGTRNKDALWIQQHAKAFNVLIKPLDDLAILAIQGPHARAKTAKIPFLQHDNIVNLDPFFGVQIDDCFVARTGYTGEDGLEIMIPLQKVEAFWQDLLALGVMPCGLGARDSLRLEAGMSLYGNDLNDMNTPLESNLAWTVAWNPEDRKFIGREALEEQKKHGVKLRLVGLMLAKGGVLRAHQRVMVEGLGEGETTSGGFSPTLNCAIALARIPVSEDDLESLKNKCSVEIRNKQLPVNIVPLPFVIARNR